MALIVSSQSSVYVRVSLTAMARTPHLSVRIFLWLQGALIPDMTLEILSYQSANFGHRGHGVSTRYAEPRGTFDRMKLNPQSKPVLNPACADIGRVRPNEFHRITLDFFLVLLAKRVMPRSSSLTQYVYMTFGKAPRVDLKGKVAMPLPAGETGRGVRQVALLSRPQGRAVDFFFRRRTACGVTSTSSSSLMYEIQSSRLIRTGGVRMTFMSQPAARTLVSFFPLAGFTIRSFSRQWFPRIWPA
jgi:hypothetical protein